ncbi:hypothetical protein BZM27_07175 [Paraburkholderia steynii]|uniref:Uncharacterized protein n=1 Tax=Paraburkholderia steynii TaxID=1245441 RepID=A0A4R0XNR4_9BURK|nr:hypothetical protein BZM27_07175 [Paraburkholderia steynii]
MPPTNLASVSGEASAQAAQSAANNVISAAQNEGKQDVATKPAQPGVTVSISPERLGGGFACADYGSGECADGDGID